jgi:hypothetical protein
VSVTSPYEFVQNTDGSIVVFSCKVGTTPKLLASFDQGVTWTLGHTFAPTAQPGSLCFWEKLGLFVYLEDSTGTLFTSSNGLAWTAAETGAPQSITSGGGVDRNAFQLASGTGHAMAACGPFLARLLQRADTLGNASQGVAYTADLLNWNYAALADSSYGNLADLYSLDGRLVAFFRGTGGVFGAGDSAPTSALLTSDLLEAPAVDFP